MKTLRVWFLSIAGLLAWVLSPISLGAATDGQAGHIVVKRAANYGGNSDLVVFLDGKRVARLTWGLSYDGSLSPGPHELEVSVSSQLRQSAKRHLNIVPGKTYLFTAGFDARQVVLSP